MTTTSNPAQNFIDLFAGLGGFRIGMEANNFNCVLGSDFNKHAAQMYEANYGENIFSDITEIDITTMPDFDVMCGGFPCQPFSAAGHKKGFEDTRGTVFFDLCKMIEAKQPTVVFLENVKNLTTHDGGNTFTVIIKSLEDLGYTVSTKVLNAADFGTPQSRERIIIIANNKNIEFDFDKIETKARKPLKDFLDNKPSDQFEWLDESEYELIDESVRKVSAKTGLRFVGYRKGNIRISGVIAANMHHSRTHKQPNRIYSADGSHPTLSSGEKSGRYFILTEKANGVLGVRKLTIEECYRIFGYPEDYVRVGALGEQYARIGNSICVPMVEAVSKQIREQLF